MKREVQRERKIPAFSISVGELEVLRNKLASLFARPEEVYCSINIELSNETLEFRNIEELKEYSELKGVIAKFSFVLSQDGRRVWVGRNFFESQACVRATAETEGWCAAATETVCSFLQSYKLWYHWFIPLPFWWMLLLFNIPNIGLVFPSFSISKAVSASLFITLIPFLFIYLFRNKLFPSSVLRVKNEENFISRHTAQLSLLIAVITLLVTLVRTYFGK